MERGLGSGGFRRLFEWFWRGRALRTARASLTADAGQVAHQRAAVAAEVAQQVLSPPTPGLSSGRCYHLAAGLFVESIGWALRALQPLTDDRDQRYAFDGPARGEELERLFERRQSVLLEAAASREAFERLRRYVLERDFENTARHVTETELAARTLSDVAQRLVGSLSSAERVVDRLMLQRISRLLGLVLALVALPLGVSLVRDRLEQRADLSAGKPWVVSSSYETVCQSPARVCGSAKSYFFHTREEQDPWLELDLLAGLRLSRAHVFNRQDCCAERALPLVLEVSSDRRVWREVARQREVFDEWRPKFATVTARYVRFRVAGKSLLHLKDVRFFE